MLNPNTAQAITLNFGVIAVEGADAAKFLQGQVTCDVRELMNANSEVQKLCLGAQCNVKGRMLLIFHALQLKADLILLFVNPELVESGIANLRKYAVFFKVTLKNVSQDWNGFAVTGSSTTELFNKIFGSSPQLKNSWINADNHLLLKITENISIALLSTNAPSAARCKSDLLANTQANDRSWQSLMIAEGIPDIYPSTQELFTPQDLNLTLLDGVNFRKGCYTGQEIVARLHYKAKLKRHMYRFELSSESALPNPGAKLVDSQGKHLGEVVMSAKVDKSRCELLASLSDQGVDDAWLESGSQKLRPVALAYAIPTDNEEASSQ